VTWTIDGKSFTFVMERAGSDDGGFQFYEAYYDSADISNIGNNPGYKNRPTSSQSTALRERLKTGSRLRISDLDFSSPQLSLRGSKAALNKWQTACFQSMVDDDDPVEAANRQSNAVWTRAARQNCIMTEDEFVDTYVEAGDPGAEISNSHTAGLLLQYGLENGSIIHLGEKNGMHSYRLADCTPR